VTEPTRTFLLKVIESERARVRSSILYLKRLETAVTWLSGDRVEPPDETTLELFETFVGVERGLYGLEPGLVVDRATRVQSRISIDEWQAKTAALRTAARELGPVALGHLREGYPGMFGVSEA